jgi:hypothetical protein
MKKQLPILIISLLLTYNCISQIVSDSITCIPTIQLKKAINIIENGKIVKEELVLSKYKITLLDSVIVTKDGIIQEYNKKDIINNDIIIDYKKVVQNLNKSLVNSDLSNKMIKVKLWKEKIKKWITLPIGIGIGYVLFK